MSQIQPDPPLFKPHVVLACAVIGFTLCTIPKFHYYIILVSTAFVGATAFMLGVDCYTTEDLKEVGVSWLRVFCEAFI